MKNLISGLAFALMLSHQFASVANAQVIGANMASYLGEQLNTRVGGGECSHMAIEALRISGGGVCNQ